MLFFSVDIPEASAEEIRSASLEIIQRFSNRLSVISDQLSTLRNDFEVAMENLCLMWNIQLILLFVGRRTWNMIFFRNLIFFLWLV